MIDKTVDGGGVGHGDTHGSISMWVLAIQRIKQSERLWRVKVWFQLNHSAMPPLQTEAPYYSYSEFQNAMSHIYVCEHVCVCGGDSMFCCNRVILSRITYIVVKWQLISKR